MTNVMPSAEAFVKMLTDGDAFVGIDNHTKTPFIYLGKGDERFYTKKVIVHNEDTGSTESKWITTPTVKAKAAATDAEVVLAYKKLLAEGKVQAPLA